MRNKARKEVEEVARGWNDPPCLWMEMLTTVKMTI